MKNLAVILGASLIAMSALTENAKASDPFLVINLKCPEQNKGLYRIERMNRKKEVTYIDILFIKQSPTILNQAMRLLDGSTTRGVPIDIRTETDPDLLQGFKAVIAYEKEWVVFCSGTAAGSPGRYQRINANRKILGLPPIGNST